MPAMSIHNADFDFSTDATHADKLAFLGYPQRTLVHPPEKLYRFVTSAENEIFGTPWWFPEATYKAITRKAHQTGQALVQVGRGGLAIPERFNRTMESLVVIEFRQPVYGWRGRARRQREVPRRGHHQRREAPGERRWLNGGLEQIYVPDLADATGTSSPFATIFAFVSVG